ncbi:MAG: BT4734/BF3469 family protein [Bacteroidota bacterium]
MSTLSLLSPNRRHLIGSKALLQILHHIQTGRYRHEVQQVRDFCHHHPELADDWRHDQLPWFAPSGRFKKRGPLWELVRYSHHLFLEWSLRSDRERHWLRDQLRLNPFVLACFRNAEGSGLCAIVSTDGSADEHGAYLRQLHTYFHAQTGLHPHPDRGLPLEYCCRLSWDPDLHYRAEAQTFRLRQAQNTPRGEGGC